MVLAFAKAEFDKNIDNIVELTLAEDPANFERIETWKAIPIENSEFVARASTFTKAKNKPSAIYNEDGNVFSEGIHLKEWWEPAKDDAEPSLTLDFKSAKDIRTVLLSENMRSHCVREFMLEAKDSNGNWNEIYQGKTIGEGLRIKLNGSAIHGLRFQPTKHTQTIQITAFNAYE